jgi:hypothetical protein
MEQFDRGEGIAPDEAEKKLRKKHGTASGSFPRWGSRDGLSFAG